MDLYIIRHAIAQQLDKKNDFTDEKRDLTSEGERGCEKLQRAC